MKTGTLTIKDGNLADNGLLKAMLDLKDGDYEWYIGKTSALRTLKQNKYLHKILSIWGEYLGYDVEKMKCIIKTARGLYSKFTDRNGVEYIVYESSRDWNKEKFAEVVDWILQTAAETGCHLQTPEEFYNQNT